MARPCLCLLILPLLGQRALVPKAGAIKHGATSWDTGKRRGKQGRWRFLSQANLKIAPSSSVIFVPWQDLQQKILHFQSHKKTMGSPAMRQRKKSILAMYHVTNRIRAMIYVWMDADWISWGLKQRERERRRERKKVWGWAGLQRLFLHYGQTGFFLQQ